MKRKGYLIVLSLIVVLSIILGCYVYKNTNNDSLEDIQTKEFFKDLNYYYNQNEKDVSDSSVTILETYYDESLDKTKFLVYLKVWKPIYLHKHMIWIDYNQDDKITVPNFYDLDVLRKLEKDDWADFRAAQFANWYEYHYLENVEGYEDRPFEVLYDKNYENPGYGKIRGFNLSRDKVEDFTLLELDIKGYMSVDESSLYWPSGVKVDNGFDKGSIIQNNLKDKVNLDDFDYIDKTLLEMLESDME